MIWTWKTMDLLISFDDRKKDKFVCHFNEIRLGDCCLFNALSINNHMIFARFSTIHNINHVRNEKHTLTHALSLSLSLSLTQLIPWLMANSSLVNNNSSPSINFNGKIPKNKQTHIEERQWGRRQRTRMWRKKINGKNSIQSNYIKWKYKTTITQCVPRTHTYSHDKKNTCSHKNNNGTSLTPDLYRMKSREKNRFSFVFAHLMKMCHSRV